MAPAECRPGIDVAIDADTAWVRIRGRAQFSRAHALRQFAGCALEKGCSVICIDLSDCGSVDSTFIGTIAMLATEGNPRTPVVRLLNTADVVREQISDLGVAHVFEFDTSSPGASSAHESLPSTVQDADRLHLSHTMLQAHEALARLDPCNCRKFRDVLSFLRGEETTGNDQ